MQGNHPISLVKLGIKHQCIVSIVICVCLVWTLPFSQENFHDHTNSCPHSGTAPGTVWVQWVEGGDTPSHPLPLFNNRDQLQNPVARNAFLSQPQSPSTSWPFLSSSSFFNTLTSNFFVLASCLFCLTWRWSWMLYRSGDYWRRWGDHCESQMCHPISPFTQ